MLGTVGFEAKITPGSLFKDSFLKIPPLLLLSIEHHVLTLLPAELDADRAMATAAFATPGD